MTNLLISVCLITPLAALTTTVKYIGNANVPLIVLDNLLDHHSYETLRNNLRHNNSHFAAAFNGFPGHTSPITRAVLDPILDALLTSNSLTDIFPATIFNPHHREHVRGFASILCDSGIIHSDEDMNAHQLLLQHGIVPPAAVFYFGFDGASNVKNDENVTAPTGTAFYREKCSGLERMTTVDDGETETEFCLLHPTSVRCGLNEVNSNDINFEEISRVVSKPNRLAMYPQDLLHNAFVEVEVEVGEHEEGEVEVLPCSPETGRLAISLFFLSCKNLNDDIDWQCVLHGLEL